MKKRGMILMVVFVLGFSMQLVAQDEGMAMTDDMGVTVDLSWVSKYIWYGYDILDDKAAWQPSVAVDLGSGLTAKIWMSYAASSKGGGSVSTVDKTEYNYILMYDTTVNEGDKCQMDMMFQYIYYDFIDRPSKAEDGMEFGVGAAWPNMCPMNKIVPHYYVAYIMPAHQREETSNTGTNGVITGEAAGWIHIIGVSHDMVVQNLTPDIPEQVFTLSADLVYNDGFAAADAKHDWSHATFGITTQMPLGEATLTPALYYQSSFEDSVNTSDELYAGLSLSMEF